MYYVRTSGGSMMPVSFTNTVLLETKKQTSEVKSGKKLKKKIPLEKK